MATTGLAPVIGPTGISAPTFPEVLTRLQAIYQDIYGADAYLGNDSQDGQFVGAIAQAISDSNAACIAVFNAFSPSNAQGVGLSSLVKLNGLRRFVPTQSTCDVVIIGQAGTEINNGLIGDGNSKWRLPANVRIPVEGEITVTVVSQTEGADTVLPGALNRILTPTFGWQSVSNLGPAEAGRPVETDPELKARQGHSVALPSLTVLEGLIGAVLAIPGVSQVNAIENDTKETDSHGVPGNSVALVVNGGDANAIGVAIAAKKTPGGGTYGTTTVNVLNRYGMVMPIRFFRPSQIGISVQLNIKVLSGYSSTVETAIKHGIADYIAGVPIGGGNSAAVEWDNTITAAKNVAGAATFKIISLSLQGPDGPGVPDVPLLFNQAAILTAVDLKII